MIPEKIQNVNYQAEYESSSDVKSSYPISELDGRNIYYFRPDLADYTKFDSMKEFKAYNSQVSVNDELEDLVSRLYAAEKYSEARLLADEMAAKIRRSIGREDLADKLNSCYSTGVFSVYASGNVDWRPYDSCSLPKLCPFHARLESKRRLEKYLPYILQDTKKKKYYFGTLTVPNVPVGELKDGYDSIWSAWTKFRRSKLWDNVAEGYMANIETTWNHEDQSFNLHLHILVMVHRWSDFAFKEINQKWRDLTASKWVWWSDPIYPDDPRTNLPGVLKEVLKYTAKFIGKTEPGNPRKGGGLLNMTDEAFSEWFSVFHGSRTMRTYKEWYGLPDVEEAADEEDRLKEEDILLCQFSFRWNREKKALNVCLIQANNFTTQKLIAKDIITEKLKMRGSP